MPSSVIKSGVRNQDQRQEITTRMSLEVKGCGEKLTTEKRSIPLPEGSLVPRGMWKK